MEGLLSTGPTPSSYQTKNTKKGYFFKIIQIIVKVNIFALKIMKMQTQIIIFKLVFSNTIISTNTQICKTIKLREKKVLIKSGFSFLYGQ